MQSNEKGQFIKVIAACLDMYGRERSDTVMALWWKLLEHYSIYEVNEALASHMRTSKFCPTPADIISCISSKDGRPTADEAWASIPHSENESVIWTEEMAQAYGVAAPLIENGDKVAARRAFIDRYEWLVAKARESGTSMKVMPSFGFDAAGRESAIQKAIDKGLISKSKASLYLPKKATESAITFDAIKRIQ
jgi:hypothetical protein